MIYLIIYFLLVHWVSDFLLQTRHMANRKSESWYYLTVHVGVYSISTTFLWWIGLLVDGASLTLFTMPLVFICVFIPHFCTDYVTSRLTKKFHKQDNMYKFFSTLGFDQWLHHAALIVTYKFLIL